MRVVKDLVPDLSKAYEQLASIKPWLKRSNNDLTIDEPMAPEPFIIKVFILLISYWQQLGHTSFSLPYLGTSS